MNSSGRDLDHELALRGMRLGEVIEARRRTQFE
jgi:hypothetical protein